MRARSRAVCDQSAFYPFRRLVTGKLSDPGELPEIERFVRTVVLHDEISMDLEPWQYNESSDEWTDEERQAGKRNVIVAIGPTLDGFDFFTKRDRTLHSGVKLSERLLQVARRYANAGPGNPYYDAHVEYLQGVVGIVEGGGSALLAGEFGSDAIDTVAEFPDALFANLDEQWRGFAQEVSQGALGISVPPILSIVLTRAARRDALPTIVSDLRDEFAEARGKIWTLLSEMKRAETIGQAREIRDELVQASRLMAPTAHDIEDSPGRVLWEIVGGAIGGAATAVAAGGGPLIGAMTGAVVQGAKSIPPLVKELGPALFRRGAFDLARRVRSATLKVEHDALIRHLNPSEQKRLGLV